MESRGCGVAFSELMGVLNLVAGVTGVLAGGVGRGRV